MKIINNNDYNKLLSLFERCDFTEEKKKYILENPKEKSNKPAKEIKSQITKAPNQEVYIKENICDIFEMHYSQENGEKYKYIIENVKKYVEKMMED